MAGYHELIDFIVDGEYVQAGVANRATQALKDNTDYLKEIVEDALMGSTIIARAQTVEVDAKVGQAVYYNATNQRFERALAAADNDTTTGYFVTSTSTQVWGVVYRKLNSTLADILVNGIAEIDLAEAIDGSPASGLYYLSGTTPGMLVAQQPPVSVPVAMVGAQGSGSSYEVLINTRIESLVDAHKHYSFPLLCVPAGTHIPPAEGVAHTITAADSSTEGWLPADDAVFGGNAPAGAQFGYNISQSGFSNIWPPIPIQSASLEMNRGEDAALNGMTVPLGTSGLAIIDNNGIWWMSNCYGDVPWPTDLNTEASESVSVSEGDSCPRTLAMSMNVWFSKPLFQTSNTAVLSLTAADDSGLVITCAGTDDAATTGHLEIALDLGFVVASVTTAGYIVFKELTADGKFNTGPVLEALKAGSSNVTITGQAVDANGYNYGKTSISVDTDFAGKGLPCQTVRLDGVTEEFYQGVIGLGFSASAETGITGRISVPSGYTLPSGTTMKFRLRVLARAAGTIPANVFTCTYRRIPKPSDLLTPVALPTADTGVAISSNVAVAADQYVEMESATFEVTSGDIVVFTLYRAGSDGYNGELQLIQEPEGVLSAAG